MINILILALLSLNVSAFSLMEVLESSSVLNPQMQDYLCDDKALDPVYECGKDITQIFDQLLRKVEQEIYSMSFQELRQICNPGLLYEKGLDVTDLVNAKDRFWTGNPYSCRGTVTYNNACYYAGEINYYYIGHVLKTCNEAFERQVRVSGGKYNIRGQAIYWYDEKNLRTLSHQKLFNINETMAKTVAYRTITYWERLFEDDRFIANSTRRKGGPHFEVRNQWLKAGWSKNPDLAYETNLNQQCSPAKKIYYGRFEAVIHEDIAIEVQNFNYLLGK